MKILPLARVFAAAFCLHQTASAATYIYGTSSGTINQNWSTGAGWNFVPLSGIDTAITILDPNSTLFAADSAIISNNDLPGNFQLNVLTLQGTGPASASASITLQGGALEFVSNGSATPVVNLNALKGTGSNQALLYNINNNIVLTNDTLFTGNGTPGAVGSTLGTQGFFFNGLLSGAGNLTKSGTSQLNLGGTSTSYSYTGDLNVQAGTLRVLNAGGLYSTGALNISGGTMDVQGNVAVSSLNGAGGTLTSSAGSARYLFVNHAGTTANSFSGTINGRVGIALMGSGDLSLSQLSGQSVQIANMGTGTLTTPGVNSTDVSGGAGAQLFNPYATIKLTGTSGKVNGTTISSLNNGTLWIAPTTVSPTTDVLVTGQTANTGAVRYQSAATIRLDKGGNQSVNFQLGAASSTTAIVTRNGTPGTLILDPVTGTASLGTTAKLTLLGPEASLPKVTNDMVSSSIVVINNDANRSADFVTYTGTGIATDVGFQVASYSLTDTFIGSTANSSVKITSATALSTNTNAFALRTDAAVTLDSGVTLALGNSSSTSTQTGLILNGGSILGTGSTLALGATEGTIFTSAANGTIGSNITGTGTTNSGNGIFASSVSVSLTKFGEGTLFLTGTNSYTGITSINAGALDVGSNASSLANSNLRILGGVLQGNGNFTRALGVSANQVNLLNDGGFAARGGTLNVNIGGAGTALTWGSTNFLRENTFGTAANAQAGMLMFGSNTSDSQVNFVNGVDLGVNTSPAYYRLIHVSRGTGTDSARMAGAITSTVMHGVLKDGAGTLIFAGNNTYTGDTVVAKGKLFIEGVTSGQGDYTVNAGATLGGANTIGLALGKEVRVAGTSDDYAHLTAGSFSAAGSETIGTLVIGTSSNANKVIMSDYSSMDFQLGGDLADQVAIIGDLDLSSAFNRIVLNIGATATLSSYTLITYTGSLVGVFDDISSVTSQGYVIDYGTGLNSAITLTAVPEPGTWTLLLVAGVAMGFAIRRRTAAH